MDIKSLSKELIAKYRHDGCLLPVKQESQKFINRLMQILFPQYAGKSYFKPEEIEAEIISLSKDLRYLLNSLNRKFRLDDEKIVEYFLVNLSEVYRLSILDAKAIEAGDPAAESLDEVIISYPGFLAIFAYRVANLLYKMNVPVIPRAITEYAHEKTGIDIHPGATIGESFCIDHGTGIVIGETTIIGNSVKIYQGVTLGALSVEKKHAKQKRHPTIEDNVIIYAQAVILGGETTIGKNSVIGGNVWMTESVPPDSVVYHKSEVKVKTNGNFSNALDFVI